MTNDRNRPILRITRPNYGRWGLQGNPFPIAGVTRCPIVGIAETPTPYPLIDPVMDKEVHGFISETLEGQEYGGMVVLGEWGAGKTYALRYIETLLGTIETRPDAEEILAVYIERPAATLQGLVADICNHIGRIRIANALLGLILADLAREVRTDSGETHTRAARVQRAYEQAAQSQLFADKNVIDRITATDAILNPSTALSAIRSSGHDPMLLFQFAKDSISMVLGPTRQLALDVSGHLAELALSGHDRPARLWQTLLSGRVSSRERTVATISGQDTWSFIMRILNHIGYTMVYWLIDEFEELEYQQQRKLSSLRAFLAEMRDLIDANLAHFALVLASTPSSWDMFRDLNPPFVSRFARAVPLPPNTVADLTRMIEYRLGFVRERDWTGKPLAPFTENAIQALGRESEGNSRVAVQSCHILLWHAATTGVEEITAETVGKLREISQTFLLARDGGSKHEY